jgi:deazaflavin-dependent oxidoreductase (nitroreductase family)
MAASDRETADAFNKQVIAEFRAHDGRIGGPMAGTPILLLHHTGARSGIERVTPLAYQPQGDGAFVIVASNGGSPTHPSWYYNLKAHPRVEVEVGTNRFIAEAAELAATARADAWPKLIEVAPSIAEFQAQTRRRIPVFVLTPRTERRPAEG